MNNIDRVFKAYDVRGIYGDGIDEDLAWKIGHAACQHLRSALSGYERGQQVVNKIVVGRDMRPHSKSLCDALIEGISSGEAVAVNIGMCDTPMVYFAVNHLGACGGIQITASHNPIEYNGFKICGYKARPVGQKSGLEKIKKIVLKLPRMPASAALTAPIEVDLWNEYRQHCLKFLDLKKKIKVVADASNGMGGQMLPRVFNNIENLEIVPLNYEMNGTFVHPPNPLIESNLEWVKKAVIEHKADFGICMDGDADRCMLVDEKGHPVRCDIMNAVMARYFLKQNPGSTIVYDLRSSRALVEAIRQAGGVPRRERVGHSFMKKAMSETHAVFGGELSGHNYFRDNYHADSGAIAFATAASIISESNKPLGKMVASLASQYSQTGEINFRVEDKEGMMEQVEKELAGQGAEADHLDGVTCQFEDWWLNLRPSNTEPLLRLNMEAKNEKMLREKFDFIVKILGEPVEE